jgi:hypothetical protein
MAWTRSRSRSSRALQARRSRPILFDQTSTLRRFARRPTDSLDTREIGGAATRFAGVGRRMLPRALPRPEALRRAWPLATRKAPLCRAFRCAEEDSNLHPVIPDQALNLVTRLSYPSQSRQIVRSVRESGRCGRIGRFGCCHGCCHDLHISLIERPSGRSPTRPNNVGCVCRAYPVVGRRVRRSRDARRT